VRPTEGAAGVAERAAEIRARIEMAAARSGRDPRAVTLVGASKQQSAGSVAAAFAAGVTVFGESRMQEAQAKIPLLPRGIEWHFIGPLQTNKARAAVETFAVVHSVDRLRLAEALDQEATRAGRRLPCFLEVNVAGEATKHGFAPGEVPAALPRLAELRALELIGLMAVPPAGDSPADSRRWFRALAELRDSVASSRELVSFRGCLSIGMSDDFEVAIEEGATHVRIGSALFGPRVAHGRVGVGGQRGPR
jgi:pyridoxal phosphate enzyme (YggS family)